MLEVPQKYREMADSDAREIAIKVVIGNTVLTNDDVIELDIYRSLGESGFNIGGVVASRLRLLALMKLPYSGEITMDVFVRFGLDDENASEYVQFGHFYGHASNPSYKTAQVEIVGYDKLGSSGFNSRCTFAKAGNAELKFPCTLQEMLEYVCIRKGLECEFECLDYTVSEMPVKDPSRDDSDYEKYYTYKEIVGFIAAAHGASAAIDNNGKLVFIGITETEETVNSGDCIDFALTYSEQFTVKGILLHVQNVLSTGSTNIFINDDSKTAYDGEISEGVVETSCPFGSIEIAENLWGQLGGFSYNSCEFTRRGRGWTELGDMIKAVDNLDVKLGGEYKNRQMIAQTIEWSFTADGGFTEHIISKAENSEESAERLGSGNVINNVSSAVGKFTNEAKNSEIFNDYNGNYINPQTPIAHVSGSANSIDKDDTITSFSNMAAIYSGNGNKIKSSVFALIIGSLSSSIINSPFANITGGSNNTIKQGGSIPGTGGFILEGRDNIIEKCSSATMLFCERCSITSNGSIVTFICCQDCKVNENTPLNILIINGKQHEVKFGGDVCILGGSNNKIAGSQCYIFGSANEFLCEFGANSLYVLGNGHRYNKKNADVQGVFIIGDYSDLSEYNTNKDTNYAFVIGNGSYNTPSNAFYVTKNGDVYAKSFNIIGETVSKASTFSARSAETPDLSELFEQITQIKTEIEALKKENTALKAEIELLKAR